jgi:hypothetical protein
MTTKLFVPNQDFKQIERAIKESGVKFHPFRKFDSGYHIEIEPMDHPLVSFLSLKYDVTGVPA